jgi:hypothetical protein
MRLIKASLLPITELRSCQPNFFSSASISGLSSPEDEFEWPYLYLAILQCQFLPDMFSWDKVQDEVCGCKSAIVEEICPSEALLTLLDNSIGKYKHQRRGT